MRLLPPDVLPAQTPCKHQSRGSRGRRDVQNPTDRRRKCHHNLLQNFRIVNDVSDVGSASANHYLRVDGGDVLSKQRAEAVVKNGAPHSDTDGRQKHLGEDEERYGDRDDIGGYRLLDCKNGLQVGRV